MEELTNDYVGLSGKIYDLSSRKCVAEYKADEYKGLTDKARGVIQIHDKQTYRENDDIFESYLYKYYKNKNTKDPMGVARIPVRKYTERSSYREGSLRKKRKRKNSSRRIKSKRRRKKTKRRKKY